MRGIRTATMIAVACAVTVVSAQKMTTIHPGGGGSPHVRSEWKIDGANITIEYGRPVLKGRPEATLMQGTADKPWRTGADEATVLKTDKMLMFGVTHLSPGSYSMWTVPGQKEWQIVFNKQTGQPGTTYDKSQDLAREKMTILKASKPIEQLLISIDDTPEGGLLKIEWGTVSARIPFQVM
jgi:hypothetical protein